MSAFLLVGENNLMALKEFIARVKVVCHSGSSLLKVGFLFAAFMLVFHGMHWFAALQGRDWLSEPTTLIISRLLAVAGITNNVIDRTHIVMKNAHWVVTPECTAVNVYILYVSFVFAYKASYKSKVLAFVTGVPFICIMNFSRLLLLGVVTHWYPNYARILHDYIWEVLFVVLVVAMWLIWVELVVNREAHSSVSE